MADNIEPISHLEKVITGNVEPISHLEKVIALYGGTGGTGGSGSEIHTHSNKAVLDKITQNSLDDWNDGVRKIAFVGSDAEGTNGWYKVAEQTCSGNGDTNITFMVTSTYSNYNVGILQLQIRSAGSNISCKTLKWLTRIGFNVNDYVVVINGMTWTLYAYQPSSQYGRIAFEILSMSSIDSKDMAWTLNFKDNNTKETTAPVATVTSSDVSKDNATDLTTHTNDTDIHITTAERTKWNEVDNKVNKTDITTNINSSSTATQVPSANYIYNKFILDNIKDICVNTTKGNKSLSKYGVDDISNLTSLLSLTSKLNPITNTRYTIQIIESIKQTFYDCGLIPVPESGLLVITTQNMIGKAIFTTDSGLIYVTTTSASKYNEWTAWQKVCTTTVEDTGVTNITFDSNDNYEAVNNNCKYFIKNGICTIFLYIKCKTPNTRNITVGKVPKALNFYIVNTIVSTSDYTFLKCSVNSVGSLQINGGTEGTTYRGVITYPVE